MKNRKLLCGMLLLVIVAGVSYLLSHNRPSSVFPKVLRSQVLYPEGLYRNSTHAFEIEVPKEWTVTEVPVGNKIMPLGGVEFNSPEQKPKTEEYEAGSFFTIALVINESPLLDQEYYLEDIEKENIGNVEFTTYTSSLYRCDFKVYEAHYRNKSYVFQTCDGKNVPILRHMLSTLKFIE